MPLLLLLNVFLAVPADLPQTPAPAPAPAPEESSTREAFAKVRRIYIDLLSGGEKAIKLRDLLIASVQNSRVFQVTDNPEKADAILRGSAKDEVFDEVFQSSESLNARTDSGDGESRGIDGAGTRSRSSRLGISIGDTESQRRVERKHEAMLTVRLIDRNDDVLWSATAESAGGKFVGASADVADKIAKKLTLDYRLARGQSNGPNGR